MNSIPRPLLRPRFSTIVLTIVFIVTVGFFVFAAFATAGESECIQSNMERYVLEGRDVDTARFLVERSGVCN